MSAGFGSVRASKPYRCGSRAGRLGHHGPLLLARKRAKPWQPSNHTYWKGYLKLSLVTCPVALSPATSDTETVRFHTMNRATGNRVASRYVDSVTGKEVKTK